MQSWADVEVMAASGMISVAPLGIGASSAVVPDASRGSVSGSLLGGGTPLSSSVCSAPDLMSSFLHTKPSSMKCRGHNLETELYHSLKSCEVYGKECTSIYL